MALLKDKKKNPNSTYWRNKADEQVKKYYKVLPCAICGTNDSVCGHHIAPREVPRFRHDPDNLIPLCVSHHKYSNDIAPHSSNILAQEAFTKWLRENRPRAIEILQTYKKYKGEKWDYKSEYEEWKSINERKEE